MCNVTYGKIPGEVDGESFCGKGVAGFLRFIKENCSAEIFNSVCEEKLLAITPYHGILYEHLCSNSSCDSDQLFCQNMRTIDSGSYTESLNIVPFCGPVSLASHFHSYRAKVKHTLRSTANANTDISMSKTLIVMVGSFTICLLPMITLNFIEVVNYEKLDPLNDFENFDLEFMNSMNTLSILASMFLIANSFMNAVIYSLMSWRFRMEAEEFFYKTILRRKNYKSKLRPSSGGLTMTSTVGEANTSFSVR
ncbi:Oidioi.mRNA.OKI2018_I69.PAR.g9388.t1.cds [Oikopleura dioica]|uniref:Oidioi.mRNA.OKI2018_I69.PAR.g9388.t1.cds n=1 Tax=Oikopleura dioica TaxID=34765 RepID=A0ABN7RL88_OIKDI|nr:Oidioi.mRNA.OKI2018_I69.PAR.g9388.t1.cds [Oikopleura dioica]